MFTSQIPDINSDTTELDLAEKQRATSNAGKETYTLQSVVRLARSTISPLFILYNPDKLKRSKFRANLAKFSKAMKQNELCEYD